MQFKYFAVAALHLGSVLAAPPAPAPPDLPKAPSIVLKTLNVVKGAQSSVDVEIAIINQLLHGVVDDNVIPFLKASLKNCAKETDSIKGFITPFVADNIKPLAEAELAQVVPLMNGTLHGVMNTAAIAQRIMDMTNPRIQIAIKEELLYALSAIKPTVARLYQLAEGVSQDAMGHAKDQINGGVNGLKKAVTAVLDPVLKSVEKIPS